MAFIVVEEKQLAHSRAPKQENKYLAHSRARAGRPALVSPPSLADLCTVVFSLIFLNACVKSCLILSGGKEIKKESPAFVLTPPELPSTRFQSHNISQRVGVTMVVSLCLEDTERPYDTDRPPKGHQNRFSLVKGSVLSQVSPWWSRCVFKTQIKTQIKTQRDTERKKIMMRRDNKKSNVPLVVRETILFSPNAGRKVLK